MKRFYTAVDIIDLPDGFDGLGGFDGPYGFGVTLDGRPVKTPGKAPLILPSRALAEAVAGEWRGQGEKINPVSLPLTQYANTATDQVPAARADIISKLVAYGQTDLLCYRAERPAGLVERQSRVWDAALDRLEDVSGIRLTSTQLVVQQPQDAEALEKLKAEIEKLTPFELAVFQTLVHGLGSLALALLLFHGHMDMESTWQASRLEEIYQEETWGFDKENAQTLADAHRELEDAYRFLTLLRRED